MKVLHTSDWHLGMSKPSGGSYEEDQRYFINQIEQILVDEGIKVLIIAGDVFDRQIASPESIRLYNETMKHLCADLGIKVMIVAGNHDSADRIASCHELLASSGLYICGTLSADPYVVSFDDVDFYLLPWITTERVRFALGLDSAEETISGMEEAYRAVLDTYRDKMSSKKKNILVAHSFVNSALTSTSDRAAEVGHATQVGADVFKGFDYVALGHIHGPQNIGNNIRYSGTPMAYSFGREEEQIKSVTVIDTDSMDRKIIPLTPLRKRITIKGNYEDVLSGDYEEDTINGYVRIEITDRYVGHDSMYQIVERFPNYLEFKSKGVELDSVQVSMTLEELEAASDDPATVLDRYCQDICGESPSEHFVSLFSEALARYEEEVNH